MIRKHNDSVKPGKGVDGTEGEDFVKPGPNQFTGYPGGTKGGSEGHGHEPSDERSYDPPYSKNESGLTQGKDVQFAWASRSIADLVEENQDTVDDNSRRAIKAGVNRSQKDK